MGKLSKKKYTVKQYSELKNVTVGAVYKAIKEERVSFEKRKFSNISRDSSTI